MAAYLMLAFGLLLALSGCEQESRSSPSDRVIQALEIVRTGKPKELFTDFLIEAEQNGAPGFYDVLAGKMIEDGQVTSFRLEHEKFDGDVAFVKVRWCIDTRCWRSVEFLLVLEDQKWRISVGPRQNLYK